MVVVYVKHYLNTDGITYFLKQWFPYVENIIKEQPGFHSINASRADGDAECMNIILKFRDMITFKTWVANDKHQEVIHDLDKYRTRAQRWFIAESEEVLPPADLDEWEHR